jgi:hypothetical protein
MSSELEEIYLHGVIDPDTGLPADGSGSDFYHFVCDHPQCGWFEQFIEVPRGQTPQKELVEWANEHREETGCAQLLTVINAVY